MAEVGLQHMVGAVEVVPPERLAAEPGALLPHLVTAEAAVDTPAAEATVDTGNF